MGCIEAVASASAILRRLQREQSVATASTIDDLARLIRSTDPLALRLVRDAATVIGEVMAMLVHMFNPACIVVGGQLARISDDLLADVRAVDYQRALPLATRTLLIESSSPDKHASTLGGVVLGIEHTLAPSGIALIVRGK